MKNQYIYLHVTVVKREYRYNRIKGIYNFIGGNYRRGYFINTYRLDNGKELVLVSLSTDKEARVQEGDTGFIGFKPNDFYIDFFVPEDEMDKNMEDKVFGASPILSADEFEAQYPDVKGYVDEVSKKDKIVAYVFAAVVIVALAALVVWAAATI